MTVASFTNQAEAAAGGQWLRAAWKAITRQRRNFMIVLMVGMLVFFYFLTNIVIFIPAGHGGVLWKRFSQGTQMLPALPEGVHVIFPWNHIEIYDLRLQEDTRAYTAIANDGLPVTAEITVRYRPYAESLAHLHKNVGADYLNVLLIPEVGAVSREIISRFKADELYAHRRLRVQVEAFEQLADRVMQAKIVGTAPGAKEGEQSGYLLIQDILIREIRLPDSVVEAIERKIQQDQMAQEYEFRLQREVFESQRKQIEAQGIKAFQDTVQSNLSEGYLRWRGIEATLNLANSPNSKVVVIGNSSSGGMPLILDTAGDAAAASAPRGAKPAAAGPRAEPAVKEATPDKHAAMPAAVPQIADAAAKDAAPAAVAESKPLPAASILQSIAAPLKGAFGGSAAR